MSHDKALYKSTDTVTNTLLYHLHGRKSLGHRMCPSSVFGLGHANTNCPPPESVIIPIIIHQNVPFQAKTLFFLTGAYSFSRLLPLWEGYSLSTLSWPRPQPSVLDPRQVYHCGFGRPLPKWLSSDGPIVLLRVVQIINALKDGAVRYVARLNSSRNIM